MLYKELYKNLLTFTSTAEQLYTVANGKSTQTNEKNRE